MYASILKFVMQQGAIGALLFTLGFMSHAYLYKNAGIATAQSSMVAYEKVVEKENDASAEYMHQSAKDEDGPLATVTINYFDWLRSRQ